VQHLHSSGWIHRDLRAENILLNGDGMVKIVDYHMTALKKPRVSVGQPVYGSMCCAPQKCIQQELTHMACFCVLHLHVT